MPSTPRSSIFGLYNAVARRWHEIEVWNNVLGAENEVLARYLSSIKGTDVEGTVVEGTDVVGTDVEGTDVVGTDVEGTDVEGTVVEGTYVLQTWKASTT